MKEKWILTWEQDSYPNLDTGLSSRVTLSEEFESEKEMEDFTKGMKESAKIIGRDFIVISKKKLKKVV